MLYEVITAEFGNDAVECPDLVRTAEHDVGDAEFGHALFDGARFAAADHGDGDAGARRITSYNVCYTKLLRTLAITGICGARTSIAAITRLRGSLAGATIW